MSTNENSLLYHDCANLLTYPVIYTATLIKRKIYSAFLEQGYDITFEQWMVLRILHEKPGLIQAEIAERTLKDKTNVTRILNVLSKNGYLERCVKKTDRRSYCIFLTQKGSSVVVELIPTVQSINKCIKDKLTSTEMNTLINALLIISSEFGDIEWQKKQLEEYNNEY